MLLERLEFLETENQLLKQSSISVSELLDVWGSKLRDVRLELARVQAYVDHPSPHPRANAQAHERLERAIDMLRSLAG